MTPFKLGILSDYYDNGLTALDASQYNYIDSLATLLALEKELGIKSTSLYSKNNNQSTLNLLKLQVIWNYTVVHHPVMPGAQALLLQQVHSTKTSSSE